MAPHLACRQASLACRRAEHPAQKLNQVRIGVCEIISPREQSEGSVKAERAIHLELFLTEELVSGSLMVKFGNCLNGLAVCDRAEMNSRSRALATAMAESMGGTARMTFAEFVANQFQYSAGP